MLIVKSELSIISHGMVAPSFAKATEGETIINHQLIIVVLPCEVSTKQGVCSSVVEHVTDNDGVAGPIPAAPTTNHSLRSGSRRSHVNGRSEWWVPCTRRPLGLSGTGLHQKSKIEIRISKF